MLITSLSSGTINQGFTFTWDWDNYVKAITGFPDNWRNSLVFGILATLLCFLIGYPLAYGIAVRGGAYKSLLLFLVIAPFFTSFLIRTISWKIILGNDGPFLSIFRDLLGLVPDNFSILNTPLAVVTGLTYQYLPFFVLPAYVSIEKIDARLVEAAKDLYGGPAAGRVRGVSRAHGGWPLIGSASARRRRGLPILTLGSSAGWPGAIMHLFLRGVAVTFPPSLAGVPALIPSSSRRWAITAPGRQPATR
jgi:hypothetical protein